MFMIGLAAWTGYQDGLWRWELIALGTSFVVISFAAARKIS
jgi:hypothetical protein